jgi:hypothetical protein
MMINDDSESLSWLVSITGEHWNNIIYWRNHHGKIQKHSMDSS